ncbi:MAG: beta-galactosidase [Armatimonadota bacterium]
MNKLYVLLLAAVALSLALIPSPARCADMGGVPLLDDLPKTPQEFARKMQAFPSLTSFARDGEMVTGGVQLISYGEKIPVGPAPHTPWARPLAGGPLKVVIISPTLNSYDTAEIERRLDCQVKHVHLPDQYYACKTYPEALHGYFSDMALKALQGDVDVILADPNVRFLSPQVAEAIMKKVSGGTGLVLNGVARWGGGGQWGYWLPGSKISTWEGLSKTMLKSANMAGGRHNYIANHAVTSKDGLFHGIPFELLSAHYLVSMEPAAGTDILVQDGQVPMALGRQIDKGRVALLSWGSYSGCFPFAEDNIPPRIREYQDYYASAMIRLLHWAANRPDQPVFNLERSTLTAGVADMVKLTLSSPLPAGAKLETRVRDLLCRDISKATVPIAGASAEIKVPALPGGTYLLDTTARDARGNSLGWGSFALNVAVQGAVAVQLDQEVYQPGQPVTVTAQTDAVPAGNYSATLRVWDALDRLLLEKSQPVTDGKVRWTFENADPLCVLHYADVLVQRNGAPYLASRTDIFVPRFTFLDFRNALWGAWVPYYAINRVDRRLRENLGFDVILCGGYGGSHRVGNYSHLTSGIMPFYTNVAYVGPQAVEKAPVKTKAETLKMVENTLDELKKFGGAAIFFQDERHGFADSGTPTEEALGEFRKYLKTRYRDIAELNVAWGRDYKDFAEVMPILTKPFNPKEEKSLAPWLEWRLWAMQAVTDIDRASARRIREALGHDAWMGLEGIFGLEGHNIPYGGTDLAGQAEDCFNTAAPYGEGLMNACQSFYSGPSFSWGGYSSPYSGYQRYVWGRALQGDWSLGWFVGSTFYNAYDTFYPQAKWVADLTQPLREGVGKLLMENRPIAREPIAFLYSQPSLYSMAILGKTVDPENDHLFVRPADWARDSMQRMLNDCGVQYSYIAEKQVRQAKAKGIKVLILSTCVALAPETCRALEGFVADGGIVVADLAPGVWDDHGAYHSPGQLDNLFGVKRDGKFAFDTMALDWGIGVFESEPEFNIKGDWLIGQYFEKTLKVDDGHALGKHIFGAEKPPAFVFKRTGKGSAILMNYMETEYRRVPEHWQRMFALELLRMAGIDAPVTLRDKAKDNELIQSGLKATRWQDGDAEYLGVLLDQGKNVEIQLKKPGHLYELSQGKGYLGKGATASLDLRDAPYALIAVMPYKVEAVALKAGAGRLGQEAALEFSIKTDGGAPVKHVVHLDVYQPDGRLNYSYSRNYVFTGGEWTGTLPLALNDPAGRWTIKARDVVSGLTTTIALQVPR